MSKLINLKKQMKKSELKAIINECIHEVLAEEAVDRKKAALKQIKEIIAENELEEAELEEIFGRDADKKYAEDKTRLEQQYKELYKKTTGNDPSADEVSKALAYAKEQDEYNGQFAVTKDSKGRSLIQYDSKSRSKIAAWIEKQGGTGLGFNPGGSGGKGGPKTT